MRYWKEQLIEKRHTQVKKNGRPTVVTEEIANFIRCHPSVPSRRLQIMMKRKLGVSIHSNTICKFRRDEGISQPKWEKVK